MGVVVNGREVPLAPRRRFVGRGPDSHQARLKEIPGVHLRLEDVGGKYLHIERYGKSGLELNEDFALVHDRFGGSRSEALRICVRLVAQAIRANKALPEV